MSKSVFRSAVDGDDGQVDAGYLGLFVVMAMVLGTIPAAMLLAAARMFMLPDHPLDLVGIAAIIGAAGGAFGGAAAGVGLFRAGDKERAPTVGTTTTTSKIVEQVAVAPPLPTAMSGEPVEATPVVVVNTAKKPARVKVTK